MHEKTEYNFQSPKKFIICGMIARPDTSIKGVYVSRLVDGNSRRFFIQPLQPGLSASITCPAVGVVSKPIVS